MNFGIKKGREAGRETIAREREGMGLDAERKSGDREGHGPLQGEPLRQEGLGTLMGSPNVRQEGLGSLMGCPDRQEGSRSP